MEEYVLELKITIPAEYQRHFLNKENRGYELRKMLKKVGKIISDGNVNIPIGQIDPPKESEISFGYKCDFYLKSKNYQR